MRASMRAGKVFRKMPGQFEIQDSRSLQKMTADMSSEGLQPVLNDYLYV